MENGEALIEMMNGETEVVPQAPVEQEQAVAPQAPSIPSFDPSIMVGALDNIQGRLDKYEDYFKGQQPQQPEPTEEERILQEVAAKLGLNKVQEENQALKKTIEEMQASVQKQQEFIKQQQMESVQKEILSKYDGISKDMVTNKLIELANTYGEEFATSLNNPKGWEFVIAHHIQKPPSAPDPIVSTVSNSAGDIDSIADKVSKGKIEKGDLGQLLASYF